MTMTDEGIWGKFLMEYLENVRKILPQSYRARQMEAGGLEKQLVIEFETRFLKRYAVIH